MARTYGCYINAIFLGAFPHAPPHFPSFAGGAHYMARTYGCYVYGIDLSVNMILTALERAAAAGNGDKVGRQGGGKDIACCG